MSPKVALRMYLKPQEREELRAYLQDQLYDLEPDEESLDEERPGLVSGLRKLVKVLS